MPFEPVFSSVFSSVMGGGFSPSVLFALSEPGVWYDPSDLSTMFQDRAGTIPVTAPGQSVGLRLDKSKGLVLGPELVTNRDFSNGTTGWTAASSATLSVSGGSLVVTNGAAAFGYAYQLVNTVVGKTYTLTFTVTGGTSSGSLYVGTTLGGFENYNSPPRTVGVYTVSFLATATTTSIRFGPVSNTISATFALDNISIRELPGNHAVANSDAARGIYGIEPLGGRRNLLTYTEQFDNAAWEKTDSTVTANAAVAPDGTTTADLQTVSAQFGGVNRFVSDLTSGATYRVSFWARVDSGTRTYSIVDNSGGGGFLGTYTPTTSWVRYEFPLTAGSTSATIFLAQDRAASGFGSVYVWGAQLETGSTATPYQRVVSQYEVTEAGKPTLHYVQYDGVDDAYVTPTITPGTDKVQVFAGVRKLSDANRATIVESGVNQPSSIRLEGPQFAGGQVYGFGSSGTVSTFSYASSGGFAAPITSVLTGLGDISGDRSTLRVNGAQVAQSTADQGTGNYLAYPLYIGRRGGTSLPFNGRDYGLIVRFGPNLSAETIAATETWLNSNTGAH